MRVVVSDSCALIDLKKGGLLESFTRLPWVLVIPDILLADELLSFTADEIAGLRQGVKVVPLDGSELVCISELQRTTPVLTVHDWAALIVAGRTKGAVLLTGDRRLRKVAVEAGIECHGVLWAVEAMASARLVAKSTLLAALATWKVDPLVRLPQAELEALARRLGR